MAQLMSKEVGRPQRQQRQRWHLVRALAKIKQSSLALIEINHRLIGQSSELSGLDLTLTLYLPAKSPWHKYYLRLAQAHLLNTD